MSSIFELGFSLAEPKERQPRNHPLLAIIGAQGVGKSTLTGLLATRVGFQSVDEDFSGLESDLARLNQLKMEIWAGSQNADVRKTARDLAIGLELIFLNRKAVQGASLESMCMKGPVALDASLMVDVIYLQAYHQQGLIADTDVAFYLKQFQIVQEFMPSPDLYIGLKVSPQVLVSRVRNRSREFENAIPDSEFYRMADISNRLIDTIAARGWPIHVVNTDDLDYANNAQHKEAVITQIRQRLKTQ